MDIPFCNLCVPNDRIPHDSWYANTMTYWGVSSLQYLNMFSYNKFEVAIPALCWIIFVNMVVVTSSGMYSLPYNLYLLVSVTAGFTNSCLNLKYTIPDESCNTSEGKTQLVNIFIHTFSNTSLTIPSYTKLSCSLATGCRLL